jgi:hypothetical protein
VHEPGEHQSPPAGVVESGGRAVPAAASGLALVKRESDAERTDQARGREAAETPSDAGVAPLDEEFPVVLTRRIYGRVFRLLADLADQTDLSPGELAGAQRALTDPALVRVFASVTGGPMSEDDVLAVVD